MSGGNVLLAGADPPLPLSWAARTHSGVSEESRWPAPGVCTRAGRPKAPCRLQKTAVFAFISSSSETLRDTAALLTSLGHVYLHFCFAWFSAHHFLELYFPLRSGTHVLLMLRGHLRAASVLQPRWPEHILDPHSVLPRPGAGHLPRLLLVVGVLETRLQDCISRSST